MLGHLVKTFRKNSFQPVIAEYVQNIVRRILFHNLSEQFGREVSHGGFEILRQKMYLKAVPWKLHTQPTTQNCVMELDKKLSSITSGWWNSTKKRVPSAGGDGTRQKNEFHHPGVMELDKKTSSITGGWWNSTKKRVPSPAIAAGIWLWIYLNAFNYRVCASSCMTFPNVEVRSGKAVRNFAVLKLI